MSFVRGRIVVQLMTIVFCAGMLSGCIAEEKETPSVKEARLAEEMHVYGVVVDAAIVPIAGATVSLAELNARQETDASGRFDFGMVPRGLYPVEVSAAGYVNATEMVFPEHEGAVRLVLQGGQPVLPYSTVVKYRGVIECAKEALIISPSCDSALTYGGAPALFDTNASFDYFTNLGWVEQVVDVSFDADRYPGLAGLRVSLRGGDEDDRGGEYEQYGRWIGEESFTFRVEPGGNYTDGTGEIPANITDFQLDVLPHSHGYHPGGAGFLGVGVATDVEFELYVTTFYVEKGPEGYSLLG